MENTKLTIEEIEQLQELQNQNQAVANELGNLEIAKLQLEARKEEVITYFKELKSREQEVGKAFTEKYGNGTIDLEKGEFISA
jgi:hypothetical protein